MSDVSLRDYIDSRITSLQTNINDLRAYIEQHFLLNDKALKLANESMLARLETMNGFRAQIKEERGNLATKEHLVALHKEFDSRITSLETAKAFSAGKMWVVMAIFAGIPTILALIALFKPCFP
jgi:hypothetical protein